MKTISCEQGAVSNNRHFTETILLGILLFHPALSFNPLPRSSANHRRRIDSASLFVSTRFDLERHNEFTPRSALDPLGATEPNSSTKRGTTTRVKNIATTVAVGLTITLGAIYALAASYSFVAINPMDGKAVIESQSIDMLYEHVVFATVPDDTTDVLAIIIGESVGGVAGAACTTLATAILRPVTTEMEQKVLLVNALADSDYFMVRAIAQSLLAARGLSSMLAQFASVFLAIVPYGVLKLVSRRQLQRQAEDDRIMDELLLEQRKPFRGLFGFRHVFEPADSPELPIDLAEVFADIIKWLAYDVYRTHFGVAFRHVQHLSDQDLSMGIESALFGALAGLSYQVYLDAVRTFTDYGSAKKALEVRTRSQSEWVTLYGTECFAASVLFGVYEACKVPVSVFVADAVSGGLDSCLGSSNEKLCIGTYMQNNPPNDDFGEQTIKLLSAFTTMWDRLCSDGVFEIQQIIHATLSHICIFVDQL